MESELFEQLLNLPGFVLIDLAAESMYGKSLHNLKITVTNQYFWRLKYYDIMYICFDVFTRPIENRAGGLLWRKKPVRFGR